MSCNLWDDCSTCTVGREISCGAWDDAEHPDDDYDYDYGYSYDYGSYGYDDYDDQDEDDQDEDDWDDDEGPVDTGDEVECSACGARALSDWNYCFVCGTALSKFYCVRCGEEVDGDCPHCPRCGFEVPSMPDGDE